MAVVEVNMETGSKMMQEQDKIKSHEDNDDKTEYLLSEDKTGQQENSHTPILLSAKSPHNSTPGLGAGSLQNWNKAPDLGINSKTKRQKFNQNRVYS